MSKKNITLKKDFLSVSLMFFLVSFIGWAFETCLCFVLYEEYCDRGFLTLPFCPIYGVPVCLIYFIFGQPTNGLFYLLFGGKKEKSKEQVRDLRKFFSLVAYYLSATVIATVVELTVGVAFDAAGRSLWSYYGTPFCFMDVICLPVSLFWGVLITFFAQFILPAFERGIFKLPISLKRGLTALLWTAILADFLYNGTALLLEIF